jgi:hypothetical protein
MNSIIEAATGLQRLEGVTGILLFKGDNILHQQIPLPSEQVRLLQGTARQMLDGYHQVKRKISKVHLEFAEVMLMILTREHSVLMLLLNVQAPVDLIANTATALLTEYEATLALVPTEKTTPMVAAPVISAPVVQKEPPVTTASSPASVNAWPKVQEIVEKLLSKVIGRGQIQTMIQRTLAEAQITHPDQLTPAQLRKVAAAVLNHIPHAGRRSQLLSELESHLDDLKL